MKQLDLLAMLSGTNVALQVLQARLVLVLTLLMTCGIFCWAMYLQTQNGIIIAAAWAVLVFLPVLIRGGERHAIERQHAEETPQPNPARGAARAA